MRHRLALIPLLLLACDDEPRANDAAPTDSGVVDARADGGAECEVDEDCDDGDPCTAEVCVEQLCARTRLEPEIAVSEPISMPGVSGLLLRGDRLVVARGEPGLEVWRLREGGAELEFGRAPEGEEGPPRRVLQGAGELFVLSDGPEVYALDVDSTGAVSTYSAVDEARDLAFFDSFVVVAAGAKGIEVVQYEDPANPRRVARLDTAGRATALARRGDQLLVGDGLGGLVRANLSERNAPRRVGEPLPTEGRVVDVATRGTLALLAEGAAGLGVVDLSEFARLTTWDAGGEVLAVSMPQPHTAAVAGGDAGLLFVDLLDPAAPSLWVAPDVGGRAHALSRDADRYAVAVDEARVVVVEVSCATEEPAP